MLREELKYSYTLAKPLIGGYVSSLTLHYMVDDRGRMKVVGFEAKNYPKDSVRWARWRMLKTIRPIVRKYGLDFIRKHHSEIRKEGKFDDYTVCVVRRELENLVEDLFNWLEPFLGKEVAYYEKLEDGRTSTLWCRRMLTGRLDGRGYLDDVRLEAVDLPTDRLEQAYSRALTIMMTKMEAGEVEVGKKAKARIEVGRKVKSGEEALEECLRMDKAMFKKLEKLMQLSISA